MDPISTAIIGICIMFLLIILQVPIGVSMAIVGIGGFGMLAGFAPALTVLGTEGASVIGNPEIAIVPLFILMGNFLSASGISREIYDLAYAFLGNRRGGLALSTICGCGLFGAICGSSSATAATFGKVALPEMLRRDYSRDFAAGCIAAGGTLGSLVPPSVILIIYAALAEEFILELFVAAVIPAAIEIVLYLGTILIYVNINPKAGPAGPYVPWSEKLKTVKQCWGALFIALVVIGGIYGGVFTVNEAASIGVLLSFMFLVIRRRLNFKSLREVLIETANTTAMIYVCIIGAMVFSYFITVSHLPGTLVSYIGGLDVPNLFIIAIMLVALLVLGSIFDTMAAMVITLPFALPLVTSMGYDPVWWGIINVVVIETGMITPPIGLNVFVLHGVTKIELGSIYKGVLPFVAADVIRLALLVLFPALIMWLPSIT